METEQEYGRVILKLDQILDEQEQSKNKVAHALEISRTQLNRYINREVVRVDLTFLARVCCVFDCHVSDVLEYLPPGVEPTQHELPQRETKFLKYHQPGKIVIHLSELMAQRELSKNKLAHQAECSMNQIINYARNRISRLDLDVLARICKALHCSIDDLLEYQPTEELL